MTKPSYKLNPPHGETQIYWQGEPEWEYGISYALGNEEFEGQDLSTIRRRVEYIRRQGGYYGSSVHALRRRPAGEAEPVEESTKATDGSER